MTLYTYFRSSAAFRVRIALADCFLVPQIFNARRYDCDLAPYATVMRVFDACMKLEAFDRAQPSKQPDAE